jgi:hypothetical protein
MPLLIERNFAERLSWMAMQSEITRVSTTTLVSPGSIRS